MFVLEDDGTRFHLFRNTTIEQCSDADLAAPYGIIDLQDIDVFLHAFFRVTPVADYASPFGVVDLSDIDAFIASFLAGCP